MFSITILYIQIILKFILEYIILKIINYKIISEKWMGDITLIIPGNRVIVAKYGWLDLIIKSPYIPSFLMDVRNVLVFSLKSFYRFR